MQKRADLCGQTGHVEGRQRGLLCRLHDDDVTEGQSGTDLPNHHENREVPLETRDNRSVVSGQWSLLKGMRRHDLQCITEKNRQ